MSVAVQRCPRCGNENSGDSYQCSFCGKRLRVEAIENIYFFRRYEAEEWVKPYPFYTKIAYLFVNPPKAFWDINHKRSKAPGFLIILFNALLYGVIGLAFSSHYQIIAIGGEPISPLSIFVIPYNLTFFLTFFIFGFLYYFLFFAILVWLFTKGANYAVGFSERLETRFGEGKEEAIAAEMSPFSIYKGGILLQKQESHKMKMMMSAFAPFLLINSIKILIVLVGFPTVTVDVDSSLQIDAILKPIADSPVWSALHILDAITIAIWVPILMTIAIRELANSSTIRVLLSSITIGIIVAGFYYFSRPTLFGGL
jgi:hypothetical protein